MLYEINWEIDLDADTPEEAAELAWEMLMDPNTTATILKVRASTPEYIYDMKEKE